jgi:VCBS repeat-containing protein
MASMTFEIDGLVGAFITVSEVNGDLLFEIQLSSDADLVGDLRSVFFDVSNESLLSGLTVSGASVTEFMALANTVTTLGGDANINGEVVNTYGKFDVGVEFGTAGIGADDIRAAQFTLLHATLDLSLAFITSQDFGLRITSVGEDGGLRTSSLKLGGEADAFVNTAPVAANDSRDLSEDGVSATGSLLANDSDTDGNPLSVVAVAGGAVGTAFAVTSAAGRTGQLLVNGDGSYTFATLGNFNDLAQSETDTVAVAYTISDGQGGTAMATLTLSIVGANDAPIITAEALDSAGTATPLIEANSGLATNGTLTVTDADISDTATVQVVDVSTIGPTGDLTRDQLLGYFTVPSGVVLDQTETTDKFTWTFNSGSQAFDFLAAGETLTLYYTIRAYDAAGPSYSGEGTVTIRIEGTADAPLFTELAETVDFNNIVAGTYPAGSLYDALGGNDIVTLPSTAVEAAEAGFIVGSTFFGGDGHDYVEGGSFDGASLDDVIDGGDGSDDLRGWDGNDLLIGGAGNDWLVPGAGDDTIEGGEGWDSVGLYWGATAGVIVNLAAGTITGGGGIDIVSSVEQVGGTGFADEIYGDDQTNTPEGGFGDDSIFGGGSNDYISGGLGNDILDGGSTNQYYNRVLYGDAYSGVTVNLLLGTATGGAGNDTLYNFQEAFGSAYDDILIAANPTFSRL